VQLLVVRHAIAEQKEEFARTGKDDSQRPLTIDGRRKMRRGTAGLRAVVPTIDVLAASPLLRAVQTAEILAAVYNGRNMVTVKELSPDSEFPPFLRWLRTQDAGGTVAIVGHEPHLSGLTSWLLTGRSTKEPQEVLESLKLLYPCPDRSDDHLYPLTSHAGFQAISHRWPSRSWKCPEYPPQKRSRAGSVTCAPAFSACRNDGVDFLFGPDNVSHGELRGARRAHWNLRLLR
jgi:phosphohistidine phosphatase